MNKTYIYKNLNYVSTNYHTGGGAVIITKREPQAAWNKHFDILADTYSSEEYKDIANEQLPEPSTVLECEDSIEQVVIFENAGCC